MTPELATYLQRQQALGLEQPDRPVVTLQPESAFPRRGSAVLAQTWRQRYPDMAGESRLLEAERRAYDHMELLKVIFQVCNRYGLSLLGIEEAESSWWHPSRWDADAVVSFLRTPRAIEIFVSGAPGAGRFFREVNGQRIPAPACHLWFAPEQLLERSAAAAASRDNVEAFRLLREWHAGRCAICEQLVECLDHDHRTGLVRGLLCRRCNQAEGNAAKRRESFRNGSIYLEYADHPPSEALGVSLRYSTAKAIQGGLMKAGAREPSRLDTPDF